MSKKHYVLVAADIRHVIECGNDYATARCIAEHLATTFKQANPAFDRTRFLTACGVN